MNISYLSDIHCEYYQNSDWLPPLPTACDVLVLAGDLAIGDETPALVERMAAQLPGTEIVWIAGNHEFYRRDMNVQLAKFRLAHRNHPRIHFLENDSVEINGVVFLGCVLWTDFSILGLECAERNAQFCEDAISDFSLIRSFGAPFRAGESSDLFVRSKDWLNKELTRNTGKDVVVVTHFSPTIQTRNKNFDTGAITSYFQSNCEDLILSHQPTAWIYGHNHYSDNVWIENTPLVSNQLGYPSEEGEIPGLKAKSLILEPGSKVAAFSSGKPWQTGSYKNRRS